LRARGEQRPGQEAAGLEPALADLAREGLPASLRQERRPAGERRIGSAAMADLDAAALRHTPLHDRHVALGARMVPFAGWAMPVQYPGGVMAEHRAVRSGVGVFDVSHMGQAEVTGPGARDFLQRVLSNDVDSLKPGGAQYSVLCREDGGVLDDLFTYRLPGGRYLSVLNAANHQRDVQWLRAHAGPAGGLASGSSPAVSLRDVADRHAMLAVQGPEARDLLGTLAAGADLPPRMRTAELELASIGVLACGTGYTGEDGLELLVDPARAGALWDALIAAGVEPCGLAARDTLRLEVCFHLYGNDLSQARGPIEAGLGWCCKEDTGFIGSDAIAAVRREGPRERFVAFAIEGQGIARAGNQVVGGGVVTSGTFSPSLRVGIGLAYLPAPRARPGERLEIDVRGRRCPAVVRERPLYRPPDA